MNNGKITYHNAKISWKLSYNNSVEVALAIVRLYSTVYKKVFVRIYRSSMDSWSKNVLQISENAG